MQLSDAALLAIKNDLLDAEPLWRLVNVAEHVHAGLRLVDDELVEVAERQATVTIESERRGIALIFTLEGAPGQPATSCSLNYLGSSFETDDAWLINWLENRTALFGPAAQTHLIAALTAPVPPPADDE